MKDRTVRVRVIAASNADLAQRASQGTFRRDLFYRLNSFTVRIPALRERSGDAVVIAQDMLDRLTRRYGRPSLRLSEASQAEIDSYPWPGNVRELINTLQRVAMLCDTGVVEPEHLALEAEQPAEAPRRAEAPVTSLDQNGLPLFDFTRGVIKAEEVEKTLITQALKQTGGNVSRAATLIGLTRASMRYRMDQYGLTDNNTSSPKEVAHT